MPGGAYTSSGVWLRRLEDPAAKAEARALGLDTELAFATVLTRDWNGHSNGARVLFDADQVAIASGAPLLTGSAGRRPAR
jgi:hypothetical protein